MVKILINENEMYEIKLPEQIKLEELVMITARFNSLLKNFSRFNLVAEENEPSPKNRLLGNETLIQQHNKNKVNKEQWKLLRENRNVFLELLKVYYNGTFEEFDDFKAKHNITFRRESIASMQIIRLKELHKIKPSEVGLIKFPNKLEQIKDLRIQK